MNPQWPLEKQHMHQGYPSVNSQSTHEQDPHFTSILVIQTAFIGDVILTTPLLQRTKEIFSDASIDVLVRSTTAELLSGNPHIRNIISYEKRGREKGLINLLRLSKRLCHSRYDAALLPHRSFRSALLAFLAGIPSRIGFDVSPGFFLYTHTVRYRRDLHESARNLQLISHFSSTPCDPTPQIYTDHIVEQKVQEFLQWHRLSGAPALVGMAPGSVWATKRWIPEGFAAVADKLIAERGAGVILFGGSEDQALCAHIASAMDHDPVVSAGALTLRESAALIAKCRVFLSNDTGIMHLAAAMRVPVVALFGATVPSFGFSPVGKGHTIIEKELSCRPCGSHGGRRCKEETFACMKTIHPDEVYEALRQYL